MFDTNFKDTLLISSFVDRIPLQRLRLASINDHALEFLQTLDPAERERITTNPDTDFATLFIEIWMERYNSKTWKEEDDN
jgi:hypothetical protein